MTDKEEAKEVSFAAEVWETLSSIDCSKHVKDKGDFTYLSWVWAWGILMENFPESTIERLPLTYYESSVETQVSVTVRRGEATITRIMWLPVMNFKNQAIDQPDSRMISDAYMRCLVKCIALHGLGHYIYANEDLPRAEDAKPIHRFKPGEKEKIIEQVLSCLENDDKAGVEEILDEYADDPAIKIKVWYLFESSVRAQLKILLAG